MEKTKLNKKILIITNSLGGLFNFRIELIDQLLNSNYELLISSPPAKNNPFLNKSNLHFKFYKMARHSVNPIVDFFLLINYFTLIKNYKPNLILTYTIKPNIYGGLIARLFNIPVVSTLTGLGIGFKKNSFLKYFLINLYKIAFKGNKFYFFQNRDNLDFMLRKKIITNNYELVSGSGVNLDNYKYIEYPTYNSINFIYVGRIMKSKGIELFLNASKEIKFKYDNVFFHIIGPMEENYFDIITKLQASKIIQYHGEVSDVSYFYKFSNALINPSFHEGMSNVILEAASCGRPSIASNIPGCKEIIDDNISGLLFESNNLNSLLLSIDKFIKLNLNEKIRMGINARNKVNREFNRLFVVEKYLTSINSMLNISL